MAVGDCCLPVEVFVIVVSVPPGAANRTIYGIMVVFFFSFNQQQQNKKGSSRMDRSSAQAFRDIILLSKKKYERVKTTKLTLFSKNKTFISS